MVDAAAIDRVFAEVTARRDALVARVRAGAASPAALDAWDAELARHGIQLMQDRAEAIGGSISVESESRTCEL